MRAAAVVAFGLSAPLALACTMNDTSVVEDDPNEAFSGGSATVFDESRMAFSQPVPGLEGEREDEFFVGNSIFNRGWVAAPASVEKFDGLGPLYNATNCSACHSKDGRGAPPEKAGESFLGLLLRLSVPGEGPRGGPLPEPTYGGQIQGNAILTVPPEAREEVTYEEVPGAYPDGERFSLARPTYRLLDLKYGPLAVGTMISPRVAPPVHGLGLLEAVSEADVLANADPDDRNGDGISGRPNYVWSVRAAKKVLGRFGWKASQPSLEEQTAGAFNGDMGIASSMFAEDDCTAAQEPCKKARSGGAPEIDDGILQSTVIYGHLLAVPARRDWKDAVVRRGKVLFEQNACTRCHLPKMRTGAIPGYPELEHQTIRPYTDLLLHDMGPDLADNRPDFEATGVEWRTPPLWGIGLVRTVNRHTRFLHDGRARNLVEAILWHGGEARPARDAFINLPKADRDALVTFLESL